jgi:hypothetical protein
VIPKHLITGAWHERQRVHISQALIDSAAADAAGVCQRLETRPEGLTDEEAAKRFPQGWKTDRPYLRWVELDK